MSSKKNDQAAQKEIGNQELEKPKFKKLEILRLINMVIFPRISKDMSIDGGAGTKKWIDGIIRRGGQIGLLLQKSTATGDKLKDYYHRVGTCGKIVEKRLDANGNVAITVHGLYRFRVNDISEKNGHIWAEIEKLDTEDKNKVSLKLFRFIEQAKDDFEFYARHDLDNTNIIFTEIETYGNLGFLADFIMSHIKEPDDIRGAKDKQAILETIDNVERFKGVFIHLKKQLESIDYLSKMEERAEAEIEREGKIYVLRKVEKMLKAEKEKLGINKPAAGRGNKAGGGKTDTDHHALYTDKLKKLDKFLPKEAKEETERELSRLSRMRPDSSEYMVADTFLDWITSLPWGTITEDNLDLDRAKRILDEDHFGLEFAKNTIIENLAVQKLGRKQNKKSGHNGYILLFTGPPGTGKTSLGKSIARATGRKFARHSLGGLRDEAEIKGHKRTYVGALPGKIIQMLRTLKSKNPVIMLDEVDKISTDSFRGDPAAALLEILDPEQNFAYTDNYLGLPFDLSEVLFILTANEVQPIPKPLYDRTEKIWFSQYLGHEKSKIAHKYLIPKQINKNNLEEFAVSFSEPAIQKIISNYTSEAGVRSLEKQIGKISRKIAREIDSKKKDKYVITPEKVREYLGVEKYTSSSKIEIKAPGIVCGLAWTPVGGELLYIEAISMPGTGKITQTGLLGESMRDSITVAEKYIKANSWKFNIPDEYCNNKRDIHLHVPAGAIKKDGPSAGITILTALISVMTGIKVSSDLAMTGEITNRGEVQPVGGVKEKVIAAYNQGIKIIIIHEDNRRNIEADIPPEIQDKVRFQYVTKMDNVLELALGIKINESKEKTEYTLTANAIKQ